MRYMKFCSTGLFVSELCLGRMTFGGNESGIWGHIGRLQQNDVDGVVRRAMDAGINFIDTANVYGQGQSETLTGQALKNIGEVAQKSPDQAEPINGTRAGRLLKGQAANENALQPVRVDNVGDVLSGGL